MNRLTLSRGLLALLVTLPTLTHAQQETPPAGYPQYNYPPPGYQPPGGYPQPRYPQPSYPQPGSPQPSYPQQGYPQPGYPGAQPQPYPAQPGAQQYPGAQPAPGYPQYPGYQPPASPQPPEQPPYPGYQAPADAQPYPGYPPSPGAPAAPAQPKSPPAPPSVESKLTLTAANDDARNALSTCLDAMDNFRYEQVRLRCGDALEKDDKLALAHALLAQASNLPLLQKRHLVAAKEINRPVGEGERLLTEGMLALAEDQRQVARAAFEAMVAQLPGDKHAHHYRGLIRYRFGDLDGAQADFRQVLELDSKFGPAHNALGHLLLRRDNLEEAQKQFAKYVELQPKEANAHDSLAMLYLRKGDLGLAVESARKSIELDPKFLRGNLRLGDALLLQGNPMLARKAYSLLLTSPDPSEHHDAVLRLARSRLYEGLGLPTQKTLGEAEKELQSELELAKKLNRRADQVQTLAEIARLQLERSAVSDAAKSVSTLRELIDATENPSNRAPTVEKGKVDSKAEPTKPLDKTLADKAAPMLSEEEKVRYRAEVLWLRALLLHATGERELAQQLADEIEKSVRGKTGQRMAEDLRGELAARSSNRQLVVQHLTQSTRPTSRLALALALGGGKPGEQLDMPQARTIMEELSHRNLVDLEGALSRGRARQWLKQNPPDKVEAKPAPATPPRATESKPSEL